MGTIYQVIILSANIDNYAYKFFFTMSLNGYRQIHKLYDTKSTMQKDIIVLSSLVRPLDF